MIMSEKNYIRMCETYTVIQSSKPIYVDVEKLRECDPPYEGETHEELLSYLQDNI